MYLFALCSNRIPSIGRWPRRSHKSFPFWPEKERTARKLAQLLVRSGKRFVSSTAQPRGLPNSAARVGTASSGTSYHTDVQSFCCSIATLIGIPLPPPTTRTYTPPCFAAGAVVQTFITTTSTIMPIINGETDATPPSRQSAS